MNETLSPDVLYADSTEAMPWNTPPMEPEKPAMKSEISETKKFVLRCETMKDLLKRDIPEPEYILKPWLRVGDSALVSARAGIGKTFFGMEVAKAITLTGKAFGGRWEVPTPRLVVYMDGEMGAAAMKSRGLTMNLDAEFFIYVDGLNQEETARVNLADVRWQETVVGILKSSEADVLIIDNLNTLYSPGERPNSAEYMDAMNTFLLKLRAEKIAVIIIDHEGKGIAGAPRGTSAKTDILHVAVTLERPEWAEHSDGAHFIVRFTKKRGFHGMDAEPFVAELHNGQWKVSDVPEPAAGGSGSESEQKRQKLEAFRIFDEGGDVKRVIAEVGIPQTTAYRYKKWWKERNPGKDSPDAPAETHAEFDDFAG